MYECFVSVEMGSLGRRRIRRWVFYVLRVLGPSFEDACTLGHVRLVS